jgi:hypothetical protein
MVEPTVVGEAGERASVDRKPRPRQASWLRPGEGLSSSSIHRTYLDEEIEEIDTPGLHHAFIELPGTTLVWGSQHHGGGESLVERVPGQVGETVLWTCSDDWAPSWAARSLSISDAVVKRTVWPLSRA